jgi:hypothetical protein
MARQNSFRREQKDGFVLFTLVAKRRSNYFLAIVTDRPNRPVRNTGGSLNNLAANTDNNSARRHAARR